MSRAFFDRLGMSVLVTGAWFSALSIGGLYFGIYLRWLFFLMCIVGIIDAWQISKGRQALTPVAMRAAQFIGAAIVCSAFGVAIFNFFGIVGLTQLSVAAGATLTSGLLLWGGAKLLPES